MMDRLCERFCNKEIGFIQTYRLHNFYLEVCAKSKRNELNSCALSASRVFPSRNPLKYIKVSLETRFLSSILLNNSCLLN